MANNRPDYWRFLIVKTDQNGQTEVLAGTDDEEEMTSFVIAAFKAYDGPLSKNECRIDCYKIYQGAFMDYLKRFTLDINGRIIAAFSTLSEALDFMEGHALSSGIATIWDLQDQEAIVSQLII